MTRLSVNINKVATLRNTRELNIPDPVRAARICLEAGAHGITIHPRPDQRHIRHDDVARVAELMREYPEREFNIEGNPFHGYMELVMAVRPTQCTRVPDSPEAFTSDHGWDLRRDGERLLPIIETLRDAGCRVSLFMDALPEEVGSSAGVGAYRIELYTEPYAAGFAAGNGERAVAPFAQAARSAAEAGLGINAGHDLNRDNLRLFLTTVPNVLEVSIGHALIADALEFGLHDTVRRYLEIIDRANAGGVGREEA